MNKKAQMTIFFIIGLVFVILVSIMIFSQRNLISSDKNKISSVSFAEDSNNIKALKDACIEESIQKAAVYRSFEDTEENEKELEEYIKYYAYNCMNFNSYVQQGYTVSKTTPTSASTIVNVDINDETITVSGKYPVVIQEGEQISTYSDFSYSYEKSRFLNLANGEATKNTNLVSSDGGTFSLSIGEGTSFTDYNGNKLNNLQIKVVDKRDVSNNPYVLGNQVYFVTDSQASSPVRTCMRYNTDQFPDVNEGDLALAWYDEARDIWVVEISEVDLTSKAVCSENTHFSANGMVDNTYTDDWEGEKKVSRKWSWDFFIEHIHRPCGPDTGINGNLSMPEKAEVVRETDPRYVGLMNKLPEEDDYDDVYDTRWKYNDFTEDNGDDTPHRYGVYATPQMYKSLLIRGHNDENPNSEWRFGNTDIIAQRNELFNEGGEWFLGILKSIEIYKTENDRLTFTMFGNEMLDLEADDYGNQDLWKPVASFEPNEHAELSIQDWDDDDLEKLEEANCDGKPCITCWLGDKIVDCKNLLPDSGKVIDAESECLTSCYDTAESIYKEGYESIGWAPWDPSQDGILDYHWQDGELVRTNLNCHIELVQTYIEEIKCELSDKHIATPMFWGYGDEKTGLREGEGKYRDPPEYGYEGVGNNDHPTSYEFTVISPLCPDVEAILTMDCSGKDKCVILLNDKEYLCEGGECDHQIVEGVLYGEEAKENEIKGWVTNTKESEDVCAHLSAKLTLTNCKSNITEGCGNNIREGDEICDGTDDNACPGLCIAVGLPNECTCPTTNGTYCGDNILQKPNSYGQYEICDGTSDAACPGECLSDCTCPTTNGTYCGDNIVQKPNSEGVYEVCDGTSDAACPGECLADCTCPPPVEQGTCIVCHYDNGRPGCFREDTSNCPNSWHGHSTDEPHPDILICDPSKPLFYANGDPVDTSVCQNLDSCPNMCQGEPPGDSCGNGECQRNKGETPETCPQDCTETTYPVCGDNKCQSGENQNTCCKDCPCTGGKVCNPSTDVCEIPPAPCTPDCGGKECGSDGCGGSCGTCTVGVCQDYKCVVQTECGNGTCESGEGCGNCIGDCPCDGNCIINGGHPEGKCV